MNPGGQLVCIVDDESSIRRGLRRLFQSAGYEAKTFPSAEAYLAHEIADGPSCLVLDVRMPGINGIALQEELAARGRSEEIVFMSGQSDVPVCAHAMKGGAVDKALSRSTEVWQHHFESRVASQHTTKVP
jgi:FixJ family two-component response regulator